MNLELHNKIALVTGSSDGIGFAIAQALQEEGCQLVLNGRDAGHLETAVTKLGKKPAAFVGDVSKPAEALALVQSVLERFGRLDILVCNVGSGKSVSAGEESYEEWQRVFGINFFSATNMVEASLKPLAVSKGSIVCVSSICGHETVPGAPVTYSVAKAALNAYVKSMSRSLGAKGIRMNAVVPGNVLFEGSTWDLKLRENPQGVRTMLAENVPLNAFGAPEDVAAGVCFLASAKASFVTGSLFVADGGQTRS